MRKFSLKASVSSDNPDAILTALVEKVGEEHVKQEGTNFIVETTFVGSDPKDLNRELLSSLRRVEKKTRLRTEWVDEDGTIYSFFDYVLKKVIEK